MDAITSLNLEAFLEALFQLDEATQKELVEQLDQIVGKYPQVQALHEAALDRLLDNYEEKPRSKLLLAQPQETTDDLNSTTKASDLTAQFRKRQAQLFSDPNIMTSETVSANSPSSLSQTEESSKSAKSSVPTANIPFWQTATPSQRADELLEWAAKLPETNLSLPDEAFDRGSIYK